MYVCLVSREYPSDDHAGGIGTYTEKTARALAQLGHSVTVITESQAGPSIRVESGVEVRRLARARLARSLDPPYTRTLTRSWAVAQALARLPSEPDVVQACEFGSEAFWYALGTARRAKLVTRLATPTFVVAELTRHAKPEVVRNRALGWLEHVQTARSDAIISPTDALADVVCRRWRMPRGGVTTMRTGVDFAQRYASAAHELPAELENREFVLYFGRLEERKGVHILAQALPAVLHAHPNLHVVFAGNNYLTYKGQPMERYVQQCNAAYLDRLHFFSRLPQNELHTFLARALFVVLPSLWEALANATLESQDMGKAVVATHGCGFGEVVQDGRTGVLVPPGNVMALRDAILRLLGDRDLLKAMSSAAHVRGADFHMERVTPQLVDFYQSLFARRAPVW